ncbi:MAG: ferrous iron transport protein A [Oscillospiraceae bacterium]|nr:ferrous iron transport protein A [Oscillospiraceae bacterium]
MNEYISLYGTKKSDRKREYIIVSVPDDGLLKNLGIRDEVRVRVLNRYVFGGPVLLRVEDAYTVAIGKDIAKQIMVSEIAPKTLVTSKKSREAVSTI